MDSKREPDLFSYIVKSDSGFAPNSYGQLCTLACCKPRIRMSANIGDWVIGTTPSPHPGKLVFAMEVSRSLTFDMYFSDPKYDNKKPNEQNPTLSLGKGEREERIDYQIIRNSSLLPIWRTPFVSGNIGRDRFVQIV